MGKKLRNFWSKKLKKNEKIEISKKNPYLIPRKIDFGIFGVFCVKKRGGKKNPFFFALRRGPSQKWVIFSTISTTFFVEKTRFGLPPTL